MNVNEGLRNSPLLMEIICAALQMLIMKVLGDDECDGLFRDVQCLFLGFAEVRTGIDDQAGAVGNGIPRQRCDSQQLDSLLQRSARCPVMFPVFARDGLMPPEGVTLGEDVDDADAGISRLVDVLDAGADYLEKFHDRAVEALDANTAFGLDGVVPHKQYNALFDRSEFREIHILKKLREKAVRQLGSSGKGNHFVDICEVKLASNNAIGLLEGNYLAILSHSGSRGLGAAIADYYTTIAKDTCHLPRQAGPFAWLSLNSEAGQEYWRCMQIAGEYSAVNHECIHYNVAKTLRLKPLANISNHHNFAWRETLPDGRRVVIHRKGATPAHQGELGIIPGSMATPGYIVSGKGNYESLFSASHGAGRTMSREEARNSISRYGMKKYLAEKDIILMGGTTEEAPQAYKDIELVMQSQRELINIEGKVIPHIVKMSDD